MRPGEATLGGPGCNERSACGHSPVRPGGVSRFSPRRHMISGSYALLCGKVVG